MLNTIISGEPTDRPPLLIVHGLFGSARNWNVIARRLSADGQVIAVDQRNHFDSPFLAPHDYPAMASDLAEVARAQGRPVDILGHSMGGKAAMMLALSQPDLVNRMVVADIAPVEYRHSQLPMISAMRSLDLTGLTSRGEADRRMAEFVPEAPTRAFLLQALDLRAEPPRWKLNLDLLEADMPAIMSFPEVSGTFDGPVLFLTGSESQYVRPSMHDRMMELFPRARFQAIEGAGHWLHADKPRETEAAVAAFLDE